MSTSDTLQPEVKQLELPLSGRYQCETCFSEVPLVMSVKSQERYDNHTLCFKHQLIYKKQQVRERRLRRAGQS